MDEMDLLVQDSRLPNQLKEYFMASKSIKEVLTNDIVKEIEDLYIFYHSLYYFDPSEFSAYTITSLKRNRDLHSFYFYLKKVIDTNLELKSKDESDYTLRDALFTGSIVIDQLFREVFTDFTSSLYKIYKNDTDINLFLIYKELGKMEIITELVSDIDYSNLLHVGKSILGDYIKTNE